jgi:hypothetical protein
MKSRVVVTDLRLSVCECEEEENDDEKMVSIKKMIITSQKLNNRQIAVLKRSSKGTLTAIVAENIRIKTNHVLDKKQLEIVSQCTKDTLVNIICENDGFK